MPFGLVLPALRGTLGPRRDILHTEDPKALHSKILNDSTHLVPRVLKQPKVCLPLVTRLVGIWLTMVIERPFQASSPPPNFPPQNQGTPAPFYVAGAEVPSQHAQRPPAQQYPPREETLHHAPNGGQPPPINTSSPPPQNCTPYSQPPGPGPQSPSYAQPPGQGRPQSTYGAQELATSVYDSPIQPHNPHTVQNVNPWSSSVHSPLDENDPSDNNPSNPSAPPAAPYGQQYQSYNPNQAGPPPVPTGQPPQPPQEGMAPPPLQPGGSAYDARQSLPSQSAGPPQPQYKPYVPPGSIDEPSAPAPNDYYRSGVY